MAEGGGGSALVQGLPIWADIILSGMPIFIAPSIPGAVRSAVLSNSSLLRHGFALVFISTIDRSTRAYDGFTMLSG